MAPLARPPSPHRVRATPAFRPSALAVPGRTPLAQSRPRELWLAIHLPSLLLDSLRDVVLALPGRPPVAIVDLERNGKIVRACEEAGNPNRVYLFSPGARAGIACAGARCTA